MSNINSLLNIFFFPTNILEKEQSIHWDSSVYFYVQHKKSWLIISNDSNLERKCRDMVLTQNLILSYKDLDEKILTELLAHYCTTTRDTSLVFLFKEDLVSMNNGQIILSRQENYEQHISNKNINIDLFFKLIKNDFELANSIKLEIGSTIKTPKDKIDENLSKIRSHFLKHGDVNELLKKVQEMRDTGF